LQAAEREAADGSRCRNHGPRQTCWEVVVLRQCQAACFPQHALRRCPKCNLYLYRMCVCDVLALHWWYVAVLPDAAVSKNSRGLASSAPTQNVHYPLPNLFCSSLWHICVSTAAAAAVHAPT
jgi:hypothetical protein